MDGSVERRGAGGTRIALDSHVELAHEGFTERFEADGVNVSAGGIAMRASYLPDVGSRLRCRFPGAPGRVVEAGAEVVWSSDRGGEFGLRFLELDDEAQRALGALLEKRRYLPPAPGASRSAEDTMDEPVSLAIDGVSSPIRTGVVSEDDDVLTVAQELPFLRLKTGVTVQKNGRRGRIEGIDLRVDGETPRLLIDIVFDEVAAAPAPQPLVSVTDEATLPDFLPEPPAPVETDTAVDLSSPDDGHDDLDDEDDDEIDNAFAAALRPPGPRIIRVPSGAKFVAPDTAFVTPDPSTEPGIEDPTAIAPGSIDEALAAVVAEPEPEPEPAPEIETATALSDRKAQLVARLVTLRDALKARIGPVGPRLEALKARILPSLVLLFGKLKTGWATFRAERLPTVSSRVKTVSQTTLTFVLRLRDKVGERIPVLARRSQKRRKTAPPPSDSNVAARFRGRRRREAQKPQNNRRRTFMISAAAFVGVGLAVWALTPGDETVDAADPLAGHQPIGAQTTAPTTPLPPTDPALTQSTPVDPANATTPALPLNVEPVMPRAVGEASREAGPMPAPTFPSLREGARPQAPQALPEGSPYAVDVREGAAPAPAVAAPTEGALFGAPDVPGGRSYLIRMSQPVSVVRGTPRTDGFTVTIPNSLSLDRAGPIAASHPLIERSMILNRGDHSELTITFVEGQSPTYRVSARGSAIEVLIARR